MQEEPSAKLFARAASCDVTPRDRPVRLAGYASRTSTRSRPSSTRSRFRAVLLECGGQRCLIFSFDLMIVGSELQTSILARLQRLGFEPDEVDAAGVAHARRSRDRSGLRASGDAGRSNSSTTWPRPRKTWFAKFSANSLPKISLDIFQGQLNHSINRRRYWPFPTVGRTLRVQAERASALHRTRRVPRTRRATVALLRKAR